MLPRPVFKHQRGHAVRGVRGGPFLWRRGLLCLRAVRAWPICVGSLLLLMQASESPREPLALVDHAGICVQPLPARPLRRRIWPLAVHGL
jgi:hypothetical protein